MFFVLDWTNINNAKAIENARWFWIFVVCMIRLYHLFKSVFQYFEIWLLGFQLVLESANPVFKSWKSMIYEGLLMLQGVNKVIRVCCRSCSAWNTRILSSIWVVLTIFCNYKVMLSHWLLNLYEASFAVVNVGLSVAFWHCSRKQRHSLIYCRFYSAWNQCNFGMSMNWPHLLSWLPMVCSILNGYDHVSILFYNHGC